MIQYKNDPLSIELLENLLIRALHTPSDFHLQPSKATLVVDLSVKKQVADACFQQPQVALAPAIVIFSASRFVVSEQFQQILSQDLEEGALSIDEAEARENQVKMLFDTSPLYCGWLAKLLFAPLLRLITVMPKLPAVRKREWLVDQAARCASSFWHECEREKLAAVWVSIYDEWRIKRALKLPWYHVVLSVLTVGYPLADVKPATELAKEKLLHFNTWT